jgi:nucleoside-diphosphate kinase
VLHDIAALRRGRQISIMDGPRHKDPAPPRPEPEPEPAAAAATAAEDVADPESLWAGALREVGELVPPPIFLAIFFLLALYLAFTSFSVSDTTLPAVVHELSGSQLSTDTLVKTQVSSTLSDSKPSTMSSAEQTFIAIKPDGVQRGLIGPIVSRFESRGYKLVAIKLVTPSKQHLETHYSDLAGKPFFPGLIEYMLSGPICAMVWEGRDAVKTGRTLLGATNPLASAPGTIRGDFAIDVGRNVCHGSDSVENAKKEIALWFTEGDVVSYKGSQFDWIYEKA